MKPVSAEAKAEGPPSRFVRAPKTELANTTAESVVAQLTATNTVYKTATGNYESADQFLMGNVRQRLRGLQAAVEEGVEGLEESIKAVEAVIPDKAILTSISIVLQLQSSLSLLHISRSI